MANGVDLEVLFSDAQRSSFCYDLGMCRMFLSSDRLSCTSMQQLESKLARSPSSPSCPQRRLLRPDDITLSGRDLQPGQRAARLCARLRGV
mmetsp:Transcript_14068/g.29222  ORF Transcript_14068/g.29222 Transcript_14068/m.29222 type:complete len:91 (+) Transcript_14068:103-375(+)